MRKNFYLSTLVFLLCTVINTDLNAKKVYKGLTTPEEQSLSIVLCQKIKTDLMRSASKYLIEKRDAQKLYTWSGMGCCAATSSNWYIMSDNFTLSPDGQYYAMIKNDSYYDHTEEKRVDYRFISIYKTQDNTAMPFTLPDEVMHNPKSLSWGADNKLYIEAENGTFSVTPEENPMVKLLSGVKGKPVYCAIDKSMYSNYSGQVRKYDVEKLKISQTSSFTGDNLTVAGKYIYFVRTPKQKTSEIWRKDITTGTEEKVLSDPNHGFVNPSISPDGKWLICAGNNLSPMSKEQNMDIFIARTDGSGLKQITYHPANDVYPTWQNDGKHVYFFSLRGTEYTEKFGVYFSLFSMDVSSFLE